MFHTFFYNYDLFDILRAETIQFTLFLYYLVFIQYSDIYWVIVFRIWKTAELL